MNQHCPHSRKLASTEHNARFPRWLRTWTYTWSIITGVLALIWLLLRSGSKPSRFVYPCQQAAFSAASLAFGAPLIAAVVAARRRLASGLRSPLGMATASLGLVATIGLWGYMSSAETYRAPLFDPPPDYRAQVFQITECPQDYVEGRFFGVDRMIDLMGRNGVKLYQSDTESPVAGPDGIIAYDDTVVIKINYQWDQRGGTNTDVLRGVIQRLLEHPDTFIGEIVVAENAQFNSVSNFDRYSNNAQDTTQSPHDVVVDFQNLGETVSHYDWTVRRNTQVDEYAQGDTTDGYVVGSYNAQLQGRVSYPKFRTSFGTYISLKYGLWDPDSETYDREHLKFINMPVLKSHHATYGATAAVKNYMGVVSGNLSTNSHSAIRYGLLGALQSDIQPADLNFMDAIWINANPYSGPGTSYGGATRRDMLVASQDPVALDIWAVKHILIPAFIENGYSPPWPYPSADPDMPSSQFREYLDNSMNRILPRYDVTNDFDQIDAFSWNVACDLNLDGGVDAADLALLLGAWGPCPGCTADINDDGLADAADLALLLGNWAPGY